MYKSTEGKEEVLAIYDEKMAELNIDYKSEYVETSFGKTHVIVTGDKANPPLVLMHGSNGCAPIALEVYPNLAATYCVYAVDMLAQPNKSEGKLLSMKDDSYGRWMTEVLAALELKSVKMVGFSLGGLAILKTLEYDESRVDEVFLAAPAYIVNGNPIRALLKIFIPMKRYMKRKEVRFIELFLKELFTDRDPFAVKYLSKVFLHFKMDFTPVPVIKQRDAARITTPITLFGADKDMMFPGEKMLKRAKKIFPSLKKSVLLKDSKHVQNRSDNDTIEQEICA